MGCNVRRKVIVGCRGRLWQIAPVQGLQMDLKLSQPLSDVLVEEICGTPHKLFQLWATAVQEWKQKVFLPVARKTYERETLQSMMRLDDSSCTDSSLAIIFEFHVNRFD